MTRAFWSAVVVSLLMCGPVVFLAPPPAQMIVVAYVVIGLGVIGTIDIYRNRPRNP